MDLLHQKSVFPEFCLIVTFCSILFIQRLTNSYDLCLGHRGDPYLQKLILGELLSLVSRLRTFAVMKNNTFRLIVGFFHHLLAIIYQKNDQTFFFFVFKEEKFQVGKKHFF